MFKIYVDVKCFHVIYKIIVISFYILCFICMIIIHRNIYNIMFFVIAMSEDFGWLMRQLSHWLNEERLTSDEK